MRVSAGAFTEMGGFSIRSVRVARRRVSHAAWCLFLAGACLRFFWHFAPFFSISNDPSSKNQKVWTSRKKVNHLKKLRPHFSLMFAIVHFAAKVNPLDRLVADFVVTCRLVCHDNDKLNGRGSSKMKTTTRTMVTALQRSTPLLLLLLLPLTSSNYLEPLMSMLLVPMTLLEWKK